MNIGEEHVRTWEIEIVEDPGFVPPFPQPQAEPTVAEPDEAPAPEPVPVPAEPNSVLLPWRPAEAPIVVPAPASVPAEPS